MKRLHNIGNFKKIHAVYLIGLATLITYYLPYILLGDKAYYRQHDFFDAEVVGHFLSTKHLFAPLNNIVPEIITGAKMLSIQPSSFTSLCFFVVFPLVTAVMMLTLFTAILSYTGMFLLLNKTFNSKYTIVSVIVSFCFAILPFYPTYCLSAMGIPLLAWALWNLYEQKHIKGSLITVFFFTLSSSVILTGYFLLVIIGIWFLVLFVKRHKSTKYIFISVLIMVTTYIVTFRNTVWGMFLSGTVSHRDDPARIYGYSDFSDTFWNIFKYGQYHVASVHTYIMAFSFAAICAGIVFIFLKKLKSSDVSIIKKSALIWMVGLFIAIMAAFLKSKVGVEFQGKLGIFRSVQFDRVYWLYPTLWYYLLGTSCYLSLKYIECIFKNKSIKIALSTVFMLVALLFTVNSINKHNPEYLASLDRMITKNESTYLSVEDFYEPTLFEQIAEDIGMPKKDYRVGSLGIAPAAAIINGFYTIDTYTTSYDLEYKLKFRKIIASELEQNDTIKGYFDNWGSRCYLFADELGTDYIIRDDSHITVVDLDYDFEVMKKMNCKYIISAVEIKDTPEISRINTYSREGGKFVLRLYEIL